VHYLIDGYNLMHAAGLMRPRFGPGGLEKARRALIGVLAASLGEEVKHCTVVFDAHVRPGGHDLEASPPPTHGIEVLFAPPGEDADSVIERLIRSESTPKLLTVVSGDGRLRAAAKRRRAHSATSDEFWGRITSRRTRPKRTSPPTTDKPSGRSSREAGHWLSEFEGLISEDDLRELAGPFADEDS
jgi:predicted RNA-binding protein with PIN domain